MSRLWWQMPGPSEFVSRVAGDLRDGKNVVLCLPQYFSKGFEIAVRNQADDSKDWRWDSLECPDDVNHCPIDWLYSRFCPDFVGKKPHSMASLSRDNRFQGRVLWLRNITENNWNQWRKFIEEYEGCSRSHDLLDRTLFCIPLYGDLTFRPPKEDVCLSVHSWRGVVDQIDISLFTSILFRTARMTRIKRFLTSSVTAHLALWDPEVAEVFSRKPWEQILEPRPVLREIAEWRGWDKDLKDENCSWGKGMSEVFEERKRIHSAVLWNSDPKREISRRIWSGQVAVLLPYIEQQRRDVLERIGPQLRWALTAQSGEVIHDLEDLEIGQIALQIPNLNGIDPAHTRLIYKLRDIRNQLSHLKPVPAERIMAALRSE